MMLGAVLEPPNVIQRDGKGKYVMAFKFQMNIHHDDR